MRILVAAVVVLILLIGGPLSLASWWFAFPMALAGALLGGARGASRTATAAFAAVAGGMLVCFLLAWRVDLRQIASASSTSALGLAFLPIYASVVGLVAAGVAGLTHRAWTRFALRPLPPVAAALAFLLTLAGSGAMLFGQLTSAPAWPEPGVLQQSPLMQREVVLETSLPGRIRWIGPARTDQDGDIVAIAGQSHLELLDRNLRPLRRVETASVTGDISFGIHPAVVSDAGTLRIFQGGGGYGTVRLRELEGTLVWDFLEATDDAPARGIVIPAVADHPLRYAVAARHGVYGYDAAFNELWRANFGATDLAAVAHDGVVLLVALRPPGELVLLDANGGVRRITAERLRVRYAEATVWPESPVVVAQVTGGLAVIDTTGRMLHRWELDPVGRDPTVATARFGLPGDPHLLIIGTSASGIGRAVLTVFDAQGAVVHREVVAMSTGLHSVRRDGGDVVLFGDGHDRVWSLAAQR